MRNYLHISLTGEKKENIRNKVEWHSINTSLNLLMWIFMLLAFIRCNPKPKETETVSQYFTINGTEFNHDFSGIPDAQDNDVIKVGVDSILKFQGPAATPPEENQWVIDGRVMEKGKDHFEYSFEVPGLYQVKHCHGLYNCAIRYILVKEPEPLVEKTPITSKEVKIIPPARIAIAKQKTNEDKVSAQIHEKAPDIKVTPSEPDPPKVIHPLIPPETYKNIVTTGLSAVSFNADCAKWIETGSIKLKPKEFCLLHSASMFGNGPGVVTITLADGEGYNQSMRIILTEGKTQFTFTELLPVLYPGKVYTLTFSTIGGDTNNKPKIANISSCSAKAKTTPALQIEYGSNDVLFDIIYKVK